jgi:hypothetical protein
MTFYQADLVNNQQIIDYELPRHLSVYEPSRHFANDGHSYYYPVNRL